MPEIIGARDTRQSLRRNTDFLDPNISRFIVFVKHCDPQLFLGYLQFSGQEFPGELDRIALKIIAKTEVTQHFEKSMVTRGIAYVLQIIVLAAGAHAAL